MATQRIIVGDARAVLATLPERSVHVCVTSPPYFGLRSYNTHPQVWGGDPLCDHAWQDAGKSAQRIRHGQGETTLHESGPHGTQPHGQQATPKLDEGVTLHPTTGAFCQRCPAWRGELGAEPTLDLYVAHLVEVFAAVKRVLREDGVAWVVIGDSYGPDKQLLEVPSEVARALKADGWWLRSRLPWLKRNALPESARDRPTSAVEYIFLLTKRSSYYWDSIAIARPTSNGERFHGGYAGSANRTQARNGREDAGNTTATRQFRNSDLWFDSRAPGFWDDGGGPAGLLLDDAGDPLALEVNPTPYPGQHFAVFSPKLVEPLILAATPEKGVCPACGAPWRRVVERMTPSLWQQRKSHDFAGRKAESAPSDNYRSVSCGRADNSGVGYSSGVTMGWAPQCACATGPPIPAVVLDPFLGAGTTLMVADRLGRSGIGVELNPDYAKQAEARIRADSPMFSAVEVD